MTGRKTQKLHHGELLVQKRRHAPSRMAVLVPSYIDTDMPLQHAEFYKGLSYLPLATLDNQGRPWVSLLVTVSRQNPSIGIQLSGRNQMVVTAETNPHDPFVRALAYRDEASPVGGKLFAGVGVDFTNRRRNKLAGRIEPVSMSDPDEIKLKLSSDQHLGNCPKYITVRTLEHEPREPELIMDSYEGLNSQLPERAKEVISQASTTFLATRHTPETIDDAQDHADMGLNHRGGAPGFVRLYEETTGEVTITYLVLPDHSGNRFYQSLGNIETDKQVGLVFPDFVTGDVLYITGNAENLYDDDAEAIMPRVSLITRINVTGAVLVNGGLNLKLVSDEAHSPYNPPVKYLRRELEGMGHLVKAQWDSAQPIRARLKSVQRRSETISTFAFALSTPVEAPLPGGFGVFDFSDILDAGYSHMNEANPQAVNEDFIRTWTLSSPPEFDARQNAFGKVDEVSITVKRKPGGLVSNYLHDNAENHGQEGLQLHFRGTGAGFTCFSASASDEPTVSERMLWVAGGVGITPFMSMWDGILSVAKASRPRPTDIVLMYAGRDDDVRLLEHFLGSVGPLPEQLSIRVFAYQSLGENPAGGLAAYNDLTESYASSRLSLEQRRITASDFKAIADLLARQVYLCGPDQLMEWAENELKTLGADESNIHRESFQF